MMALAGSGWQLNRLEPTRRSPPSRRKFSAARRLRAMIVPSVSQTLIAAG